METIERLDVKKFGDHKAHFEERLFQRYGLMLSDGEYEDLCNHKKKHFKGFVTKNSNKTVGYVNIHGVKVYVLYYSGNDLKCFPTCYPADVETNMMSALKACFGSSMGKIALLIYEEYLNESDALPKFEDVKEAALYLFSETMFPQLHIEKIKYGTVGTLKVMTQINRIIKCENPHVKLFITKRPLEETQMMRNER